jgi:ABC-2 type transport system ATP-binding protein
MLKAEHIKKTYNAGKKVALDDFSIHVPKAVFMVF